MKLWEIRYINPVTNQEDGGYVCDLEYLETRLMMQIGDGDSSVTFVIRNPKEAV